MMNEHIKEYCEKFIESKENPHYAVFLNGKWGTGKTFFIDQLLKKYTDKTTLKKKEIIKISLFGVKNTEDIDLKIYQALHPYLSSKPVKLLGAVLKSAVKLGTHIDLNKDGKDDISISTDGLGEIKFGGETSSISKRLIVVDDFERAVLSPEQIFAYFSEIITESNTRIIFIGNEEKIYDEDAQKKNEYLRIKEKTIGIEFTIEPDKNDAIESFVTELSLEKKDFFIRELPEIMEVLKCSNLRTIWQTLYNLNLFIKPLDTVLDDDDREYIFRIFMVLYIQKNEERLHKTHDILTALTGYFKYRKSYNDYCNWLEEKEKLFFLEKLQYIPLQEHWNKIIFEGYYNTDLLKKNYETELKLRQDQNKEKSNLFKLIEDWRNLSKTEFKGLIDEVFSEFKKGKYYQLGDILLFGNYMFLFSKLKLIPESVENISGQIEEFLISNAKKVFPVTNWEVLRFGYGRYGFNFDVDQFNDLYEKSRELNKKYYLEQLKTDILNDLELLKKDAHSFCRNFLLCNGNNKYYKVPILSLLDMNTFYGTLKEISADDQENILWSFEERYGKHYSNKTLNEEYKKDYESLKKLAALYKADSKSVLYDPQAFLRNSIGKKWSDLVDYFERKYPELKATDSDLLENEIINNETPKTE